MLDPDRYHHADKAFLKSRYIEVSCSLASLYRQLHDTIVREREARFAVFYSSQETSIAGRERDADAETLPQWIALQDVKADIADYETERETLLFLIELCQQ